MRVLAISGSLRSRSTNTSLLRSLLLVAPPELEIVLYQELDQIPAFNPDLEENNAIEPVIRFRTAVANAAAVLLSTPEYAHGIPGALKNALDWIVGTGELSEKTVVLVNASSRGLYAQAALKEVLSAMNAKLLPEAEVTLDLPKTSMTADGIAADQFMRAALERCIGILMRSQS